MNIDEIFQEGSYCKMSARELRELDNVLLAELRTAETKLQYLERYRRSALLQGINERLDEFDSLIAGHRRTIERAEVRRAELTSQSRPSTRHPGKHWRDFGDE